MQYHSDSINEISKALSQFQGDLPTLAFDKEASIKGQSKTGKDYEYKYAYLSLTGMREGIKELLAKNELAFVQVMDDSNNKLSIITILTHSSGQWFRGSYPVVADVKDPQKVGAVVTYAKRYALAAILGIVADSDDDGNFGNMARDERKEKAVERENLRVAEEKKRRDMEVLEKVSNIELRMNNCGNIAELLDVFKETQSDFLWLRRTDSKAYNDLVIKKDNLKKQLEAQ